MPFYLRLCFEIPKYQGGTRAQIEGVRVHKNYRSKGIGKQLPAYLVVT